MATELPFIASVAIAGAAYLVGQRLAASAALLRRYHVPEPLLGGLLFAALLLLLRLAGHPVEVPQQGDRVDFLMALLTTNMGLHVTPKVLRDGFPLFLLFLTAAVAVFFVDLVTALPLAIATASPPLPLAILTGPLSFVGAPYNLNPPSQTEPLRPLFEPFFPDLKAAAQGMAMLGVLAGTGAAAIVGKHLFERAGERPPAPSAEERRTPQTPIGRFAARETAVLVLVLSLIALSFALQHAALRRIPGASEDKLPVVVLGYALGAVFRLAFEALVGPKRFFEDALTVLLLGPTMSLVLTYAVMSVPLHRLALLTPAMIAAGLMVIAANAFGACCLFPLFARFTSRYYAAVIATAFLGLTTGWGPIAMAFLRRFTDADGPVEPMPVIMPLNAFFIFPWTVLLLIQAVFAVSGSGGVCRLWMTCCHPVARVSASI